jgi:hypothetical protein
MLDVKYYELKGVVHGDGFVDKTKYVTRTMADNQVEKLLYRNNLQVEDVIQVSKHVKEYYCGDKSAFWVSRVVKHYDSI